MAPFKLISWQVNGLAGLAGFVPWVQASGAAVVALQAVRGDPNDLPMFTRHIQGYSAEWSVAENPTHNGVMVYSATKPQAVQIGLGLRRYDAEGRVIILRYPEFVLVNVLAPTGTRSRAAWFYKMAFLHQVLETLAALRAEGLPVVVCAALHIAHTANDVARPIRVAGYMAEERDWISELLELGFVDTFRYCHPERVAYTWWSARLRAQNQGWRVDYIFVSADLQPLIESAEILDSVAGSEHCPVSVTLALGDDGGLAGS